MAQRETLASRMGFLLVSAGCAIGLGNVWRFPFITGKYGGAVFVCAYLVFLAMLALPILVMEFSVGRASRKNLGDAYRTLEPAGTKWHCMGWISLAGSYMLMMFYIPVAGWMLNYTAKMALGELAPVAGMPGAAQMGQAFGAMLSEPGAMIGWAFAASAIGFFVCLLGVRSGVERISKVLMSGLLVIMFVLVVRAVTLPGAAAGLAFYLAPDFERAVNAGIWSLLNDAMSQAFFTLSVGVGSMCIFGSYLQKGKTIMQESLWITGLDTLVALLSGLIIFPACFAFNTEPGAGPGLIFITLPQVFNAMPMGRLWGTLFFVFMSAAALTTVIAVVENIVSYGMDGNVTAPWGTAFSTDISMSSRRGYSQKSMNTNELLWNAQLSHSFFNDRSLTLSIQWYDILRQRSNVSRMINAQMRSDYWSNAINAYFMVHLQYRLNIFGGKKGNKNDDKAEKGPDPQTMRGQRGEPSRMGRPNGDRPRF
ncbi:MAG: sodium-dependent transporter [Duodenibacillus sp.]|nr:sodium-dependent transporter [Duodenibacillus sp.]